MIVDFIMTEFKQRLRVETKMLHDELEDNYPFKELVSAECDQSSLTHALYCFKLLFEPLTSLRNNTHQFYLEANNVFIRLGKTPDSIVNSRIHELELIALEYLFLGSRIGNKLVLEKNPKIIELQGSDYLQAPFPSDLWGQLLEKLSTISSREDQELIIREIKRFYIELIKFGKLLELVKRQSPY